MRPLPGLACPITFSDLIESVQRELRSAHYSTNPKLWSGLSSFGPVETRCLTLFRRTNFTKIFKTIKSLPDTALQKDISSLVIWSDHSGLSFSYSKSKAQRIARKLRPVTSNYHMKESVLEFSSAEKDLGLCITDDLTWSKHVGEQYAKTNKLLEFIRRNTRFVKSTLVRRSAYLALVRPHLGYATQVWSPQSIELKALFFEATFSTTLQCNADDNETLQVAGIHVTRCNWLDNVAKNRRFCNFFAIFRCVASCRDWVLHAQFPFCNLLCNGVALQVAGKIASCNRAFIRKVERIQRRPTKFILGLPSSCNRSYPNRLIQLNLLPTVTGAVRVNPSIGHKSL